jgi:hypothetical protein
MESGSANKLYNTEIKSARRHSTMGVRLRSRHLHMAGGWKNKQDFMDGKHQ